MTEQSCTCQAKLFHAVFKAPCGSATKCCHCLLFPSRLLCFDLEFDVARLEETHYLVCCRHSCIVVGLQCLGTHLLFREDNALPHLVTNHLGHIFGGLGGDITEIAEIWPLLQHG